MATRTEIGNLAQKMENGVRNDHTAPPKTYEACMLSGLRLYAEKVSPQPRE
jgi:hypothetical protein